MAGIPKARWRTSALKPASRRKPMRSKAGHRIIVATAISPAEIIANAEQSSGSEKGTLEKTQVPLVKVLDSFRDLDDQKSRVVGGFFYGESDTLTTTSSMDAMALHPTDLSLSSENEGRSTPLQPSAVFCGVASPGSQVSVSITDEVGQPLESRVVYADAGGNWLAELGRLSTLDESGLVSIEVLPSTWGGKTEPKLIMFDFPAQKILDRGDKEWSADRDLFAAVFEGANYGGSAPAE
jgi:hypothetical protein